MATPATQLVGRRLAYALRWLVSQIILEKAAITGALIIVIGLIGVLLTAVTVIWFPAPDELPSGSGGVSPGLNTVLIDQLELWIEEVDGQKRAGLALPDRAVFVTDDLKVEDGI